jgi:ribonuclease Z
MPIKVISRCLLNTGDSVQRFCSENKIKLDRISSIVLTSMAPHNVAGLAGILQSMSDLGIGSLTIVGPSGLEGLLHNMRSFVNRKLV